jgi:hypothetical protein
LKIPTPTLNENGACQWIDQGVYKTPAGYGAAATLAADSLDFAIA